VRSFRLIPSDTSIPFMRFRKVGYAISAVLVLASLVLLPTKGLNLGIDFRGGTLIEVRMPGAAADLGAMRATLGGLGLGEVALQEFGAPDDVLIRIERQSGDDQAQQAAVGVVREALNAQFGEDIDYRRVEFVGPKVSEELFQAGALAVLFALIALLAYIWFRFEWQFSVGAIAALLHDALLTLGLFSLLGLEFNLSTVAAVMTIVGYSLNDTVVIYDRVRENLRRFKTMPLEALLDKSINDTLARTIMTSVTTLIALVALFIFGGPVIQGFTIALIWGVIVGTYSTIFIAAPILIHLNLRAEAVAPPEVATP